MNTFWEKYVADRGFKDFLWLAWHRLIRQPVEYPACRNCGYPVIGLSSPTCPECGSDFRSCGVIDPELSRHWKKIVWYCAIWCVLLTLSIYPTFYWFNKHLVPSRITVDDIRFFFCIRSNKLPYGIDLPDVGIVVASLSIEIRVPKGTVVWPFREQRAKIIDLYIMPNEYKNTSIYVINNDLDKAKETVSRLEVDSTTMRYVLGPANDHSKVVSEGIIDDYDDILSSLTLAGIESVNEDVIKAAHSLKAMLKEFAEIPIENIPFLIYKIKDDFEKIRPVTQYNYGLDGAGYFLGPVTEKMVWPSRLYWAIVLSSWFFSLSFLIRRARRRAELSQNVEPVLSNNSADEI